MGAALSPVRRAWARVALLALAAHVTLLVAWPLVRPLYAPAFRAFAVLAVGVIDPLPGAIEARFEPRGADDALLAHHVARMDTRVRLRHRELAGADSLVGASSFFHGWWPTTVLVALVLAGSAAPWPVRLRRLAWLLVALHAFLAARCALVVYYGYAASTIDGRPAVPLSPGGARALQLAWHFVTQEPLTNYLVPLALGGLWGRLGAGRDALQT